MYYTVKKKIKEAGKISNISKSNNSETPFDSNTDTFVAVVVANFGNQITVQDENFLRFKCLPAPKVGRLVAGDMVVMRKYDPASNGEPKGEIIEKKPRENILSRPNSQKKLSPIAANLDFIIIVIAGVPTPQPELIDRYIVASEISHIEPILTLNKCDLLTKHSKLQDLTSELLNTYKELGYKTARTSAVDNLTADLKKNLFGKTSIFVGQSGVGKSSLINSLLKKNVSLVAPLSPSKSIGTHTTTAAQLFNLENGGSIIDSPGIREFELWNITENEIATSFKEFSPFLGKCQFRNCKHDSEPNCAIKEAVSSGLVNKGRWASFRRIIDSEKI